MEDAIKGFKKQFDYDPVIENEGNLKHTDKFITVGMGGSHLAAGLLKRHNPELDLLIHRDYGLPRVPEYFLKESLIILSSFSGNTEEVLEVGELALKRGLSLAVMTDGGKLLAFGKDNKLPTIDLPNPDIEPRMAVPLMMIALTRLMKEGSLEEKIKIAGKGIDVMQGKDEGVKLAEFLKDHIPLVYSSTINLPIALNFKIKFNETGKTPAFYNVFPEFNHNELSGFDVGQAASGLTAKFLTLLIEDDEDHPRIKKRMDIYENLMKDKGIETRRTKLVGESTLLKIFNSTLLGEWTALTLAKYYGVPDAKTPLISEFKKRMS